MLDRVVRLFLAYDSIATIALAIVAIGLLCYIAFSWLTFFYSASAWAPFVATALGILAFVSIVLWALRFRRPMLLVFLFVLLIFVAVPVLTAAGIDVFLPDRR